MRVLTTLLAVLLFAAPAAAFDLNTEGPAPDRVLGDPDAPVTLVEYSSLTCPHCANFHADTLPALKEEYIDTGKVRLVYRDYPLDRLALAGSVTAHCAAGDDDAAYFAMMEALFASQAQWAQSEDPLKAIAGTARLAGLSQADFEACLADEALARAIVERMVAARDAHGIESTPTFVIGGERINGNMPIEVFAEKIEARLK